MDARDGQVPAPRRPALPRLRRPAATPTALPFAVPGDEPEPRVADLSALLADIDALRLTLQTDLSLAAAAVEAGADELAGELVDGDLTELRAFASRSADRLASLASDDAPVDEQDALPAVTPLRRRRILSAGPLMAAAAAVIGFVAFVPGRGATVPDTSITSAALAGYELSRLAQEGAPDEELREAAEELNDELAELIAQAASDPAAAQQALLLLEQTTQVLSTQGDSGVLRGVIAETRALRERLREALPVAQRATRSVRTVTRPAVPTLPRVESAPQRERTAESQKSSPKPAASATSAPKASPTPTPAQPSAAPTPSTQPSPQPSEAPDGPLPGYDGLPGS